MSFLNSEHAVKPGDRVVLGAHDMWQAWNSGMEQYVGCITKIKRYAGTDYYGKHRFFVEIDNGDWQWRVENMSIAPEDTPEGGRAPINCIECGIPNKWIECNPYQYMIMSKTYVCKICSDWRDHLSGRRDLNEDQPEMLEYTEGLF